MFGSISGASPDLKDEITTAQFGLGWTFPKYSKVSTGVDVGKTNGKTKSNETVYINVSDWDFYMFDEKRKRARTVTSIRMAMETREQFEKRNISYEIQN